ncbi:NADPH:quinone reductase [Haloferacaceae archaeon DSL9]
MKAVRYHEYGDESVLQVDDVDVPEPGADEVRIEVRAASINPIDTYIRAGNVEPKTGLPQTTGSDLAGVVDAVGENVVEFQPGDRVYATALGLFEPGSLAEYATVPASVLASLPDSVSFEEGAAAAMTYATAWRALVDRGELAIDDVCVVSGASGGVGHAGVQIAKAAGAFVVGLARDGDSAAFVSDLGADAVVDYAAADLAAALEAATGGRPIDVVLESHADANLQAELVELARGGRIVVIGEDNPITLDAGTSMTAKQADLDLRFMSLAASRGDQKRLLESAARFLADGRFTATVDSTYALADAADAYGRLSEPGVHGCVVVDPTA